MAELKRLVPPAARQWDERARVWWVGEAYGPVLRRLAVWFDQAVLVEGSRRENLLTGAVEEQLELF